MMYDIRISEQAEADLRGIFEYIAYELQSVQNVAGQLDRLEKSISSLDQMPERYRAYDKEPWRSRGLPKAVLIGQGNRVTQRSFPMRIC